VAGKIDYIMTKSISRFARNTVDTLNCVRQLRQLSPPVGILFEKENIDTLDAAGELILTILSALAQDESRSLSDNIRWTFQKNFQSGKPQINLERMLGYDKGENGEWVVNEEQAKVVRFFFQKYVSGYSALSIAKMANEEGMRTVNGKMWRADSVLVILRNEKYVGDLEMQKTITTDFLTHKTCVNSGEAPKYYVRNHHAAIIDRFTWEKVQVMLNSGKKEGEKVKRGTIASPFFSLVCGAEINGGGYPCECGESFFRMTYSGKASGYCDERSKGFDPETETETYSFQYPVWKCRRKSGCSSIVIRECALEQSFMEMLYALKREYVAAGEQSFLCTRFKAAYDSVCRQMSRKRCQVRRLEALEGQMKEWEQGLAAMKQNYDFFLQCLTELPEENPAGMKINVNGLDADGSMFRDYCGKAKTGVRSAVNKGCIRVTPERIMQAPDYLRFEKGIYAAFIRGGKVRGDVVEYATNFGVKLVSTGNSRTLGSFLGFRRGMEDGTVEFLDEIWKVNGKAITYRRKKRKRIKRNEDAKENSE